MRNIIILLITVLISSATAAQKTYIHSGNLLDVKSGKMLQERTIIISDGRVEKVVEGFVTPEGPQDRVLNLREMTVLPGLIDMHVHLESETHPNAYLEEFTLNPADYAFGAVGFADTTLKAGFTTVRDLGGTGVNISLRNAINAGKIPGPRIFTSGKSLATTGGHADPTNGRSLELAGDPGPREGVVNGPYEAAKAVRQRYKNGGDLIKITATGGVLSVAKSSSNPQFTLEEIKAITETAADYGFLVAAHAHGDEGMQRAVLGGVKTIEHGTLMSEETMELMKQHNTYLVPTITAGKEVSENARIPDYYPAVVVPKALEIGPKIQNTFAKAYEKGVPIAFGTDAGVFPHGENAREFAYMVEAGMPAIEAIRSATLTPAKILEKEKELGQIAPGFYADIIAVKGNPLEQIDILQKVIFVMKEGKVYKQ